jgi:tRNA uridine 5-carbamoylmethylation protein Kti12
MTYKIGLVGAPSSGKSVLATRLTAELLERGVHGSKLVTEYALEYLGMGKPITKLEHQVHITTRQMSEERYAEKCNFNPIICDSALWIGKVYAELNLKNMPKITQQNQDDVDAYLVKCDKYKEHYDLCIYVPLFSRKSELNTFRVHNAEQAMEIDKLIRNELKGVKNVIKAPKSLKDRESFIKYISGEIIENINKSDE